MKRHLQTFVKPNLFNLKIELHGVDLIGKIDFLHGITIQRRAQKRTQFAHHLVGELGVFLENQGRYGIQGIEQKMGIELIAQHAQLGLMGHAFRLDAALNL